MNNLNGIVGSFALYNNGEKITEFDYSEAKEINGSYILWNRKKVVLYDKETMTKKLEINDNIFTLFFKEKYFIVRFDDGKEEYDSKILTDAVYGYDGKVLIEPYKHTDICTYQEVIVAYSSSNENYIYGLDGKELIKPSCTFEEVYLSSKIGVIVKKDGKYGLYSFKGELLIPIKYDSYKEVSNLIISKLEKGEV